MSRRVKSWSPTIRRVFPILGVMAALSLAPALASGAVLYDQTDMADPNSNTSQEFPDMPSFTNQVADDFTVPPDQAWTISEVDVRGITLATAPINAYLYSSAGTLPGDQIFAQQQIAATGGPNYAVPLSGTPQLTPGTYWVSIQARAPTGNQWYWTSRVSQAGNPAAWRNPGNGFATGCVSWTIKTTCIGGGPDQLFKLLGTTSPYTPPNPPNPPSSPSNAIQVGKPFLNKKKGTAKLPVSVPGPGNLALTGKGVVAQRPASISRAVSAAGIVNLLVKPKGKTKKKLLSTGKAKVKVTITFVPTGGTPNSQQKTIKLKKTLH